MSSTAWTMSGKFSCRMRLPLPRLFMASLSEHLVLICYNSFHRMSVCSKKNVAEEQMWFCQNNRG